MAEPTQAALSDPAAGPRAEASADAASTGTMTDSQNWRMLMLLLPKLPLIVRVAVTHVLHLAESSSYLDLRSALVISVIRSFVEPTGNSPRRSVSAVQKMTLRDAGVRGRIWVSNYATPPPPEMDIRDGLMAVVRDLRDTSLPEPDWRVPDLVPVEAEWTGYRAGAAEDERPPDVSDADKYNAMMAEVTHPTTVLYLHGGAYYLCDPATHRPTTRKLARLTGGRCYSVRYRLAPQHPFPAALLDAFVAYFTLLYPPPGAYHKPVMPNHIVVSGDSAGGNLTLALSLLLRELNRKGTTIQWYGEERPVPMPAGIACNSPWLDITQSSPTWERDSPTPFDYLPKNRAEGAPGPRECELWPASPPRKSLYVDDALATHPLVSVLMNRDWRGLPPIYMCAGWEILAREDRFLARLLAAQGATVVFEEYEAMPHCFAMILTWTPSARRCFDAWSAFIRKAVGDPAAIESTATTIRARSLEEVPLEFEELSDMSEDQVRDAVAAKAALQTTEASAKL